MHGGTMKRYRLASPVGLCCAVLGGLAACKSGDTPSATTWLAKDLGVGRCVATNMRGQVLGIDDSHTTFVVAPDGTRTTLGVFASGEITIGVGLTDAGDVVGYSEGPTGRTAVRHSAGVWRTIDGLVGPSAAIAASGDGQVVGFSRQGGRGKAFALIGGALADLALLGDRRSAAYLASGGRIAGIVETSDARTHAFLVRDGQLRELGTLGGKLSAPLGINKRGDLVGAAETASGERRAWLLPAGQTALVDLAPLVPGAAATDARGIDDAGNVAVNVEDASAVSRPVVLIGGKSPVDILPKDTVGRTFVGAHVAAMTGDGRIVGWGMPRRSSSAGDGGSTASGGDVRCLLWTKVTR